MLSHVFHQFWKALGHSVLWRFPCSCFFVVEVLTRPQSLCATTRTYAPLRQLSLQLNLTSSIISPLSYSIFFQVRLVFSLVLFFPINVFHYLLLYLWQWLWQEFIKLQPCLGWISGLSLKSYFIFASTKPSEKAAGRDTFLDAAAPVKYSQETLPPPPQDKTDKLPCHLPWPLVCPFSAGFTLECELGSHSPHPAPTWT